MTTKIAGTSCSFDHDDSWPCAICGTPKQPALESPQPGVSSAAGDALAATIPVAFLDWGECDPILVANPDFTAIWDYIGQRIPLFMAEPQPAHGGAAAVGRTNEFQRAVMELVKASRQLVVSADMVCDSANIGGGIIDERMAYVTAVAARVESLIQNRKITKEDTNMVRDTANNMRPLDERDATPTAPVHAQTVTQIGWYNVKYKSFFRLGEYADTERNDELLASGEIIRVYALAAPPNDAQESGR